MVITETRLKGAFVIELEPIEDVRGFFARAWSDREFETAGLTARFVETNVSFNNRKGTLRGMHFQAPPHEQVKLVRCTRGAIFDALIDLRPESPTYKQWFAHELTADNRLMLYIPEGFAHGLQTLQDDTRVNYLISKFHVPGAADGARYNDPAFPVKWPLPVTTIAEKDLAWPDFKA